MKLTGVAQLAGLAVGKKITGFNHWSLQLYGRWVVTWGLKNQLFSYVSFGLIYVVSIFNTATVYAADEPTATIRPSIRRRKLPATQTQTDLYGNTESVMSTDLSPEAIKFLNNRPKVGNVFTLSGNGAGSKKAGAVPNPEEVVAAFPGSEGSSGWWWVLGCVVVLAVCGGLYYYWKTTATSSTTPVVTPITEAEGVPLPLEPQGSEGTVVPSVMETGFLESALFDHLVMGLGFGFVGLVVLGSFSYYIYRRSLRSV